MPCALLVKVRSPLAFFMLPSRVFQHVLCAPPPSERGAGGSREAKMTEFPVGLIFMAFKAERVGGGCEVSHKILSGRGVAARRVKKD